MKSITLFINNEEKTFTTPFVSGMVWRKWIELQEQVENIHQLTLEEIDGFVNLAVLAFNNQFTAEQYYEGIPFEKILRTVETLFIPDGNEDEGNGKKSRSENSK